MVTTAGCSRSERAPRPRSFASPAAAEARRPSSQSQPDLGVIRCISLQCLQAMEIATKHLTCHDVRRGEWQAVAPLLVHEVAFGLAQFARRGSNKRLTLPLREARTWTHDRSERNRPRCSALRRAREPRHVQRLRDLSDADVPHAVRDRSDRHRQLVRTSTRLRVDVPRPGDPPASPQVSGHPHRGRD